MLNRILKGCFQLSLCHFLMTQGLFAADNASLFSNKAVMGIKGSILAQNDDLITSCFRSRGGRKFRQNQKCCPPSTCCPVKCIPGSTGQTGHTGATGAVLTPSFVEATHEPTDPNQQVAVGADFTALQFNHNAFSKGGVFIYSPTTNLVIDKENNFFHAYAVVVGDTAGNLAPIIVTLALGIPLSTPGLYEIVDNSSVRFTIPINVTFSLVDILDTINLSPDTEYVFVLKVEGVAGDDFNVTEAREFFQTLSQI